MYRSFLNDIIFLFFAACGSIALNKTRIDEAIKHQNIWYCVKKCDLSECTQRMGLNYEGNDISIS